MFATDVAHVIAHRLPGDLVQLAFYTAPPGAPFDLVALTGTPDELDALFHTALHELHKGD